MRRALLVLVSLLTFAAVAAVGTARYEAQPQAVVVAGETAVRTDPSPTAGTVGSAPEGAVLPVTDERGGWRAVRLPDGNAGWVASASLEDV